MILFWLIQHFWKVLRHKWFVAVSGSRLGVSWYQILAHDLSKLGWHEAHHYARHFNGDKSDEEGFARAFEHHVYFNKHHWEYWTALSASYLRHPVKYPSPEKMPEKYAREMVADWMAASRSYTDSWDLNKWLSENFEQISLHPDTRIYVSRLLRQLGYIGHGCTTV